MIELSLEQCDIVSGASHEYAEACLVGGAVGGYVGSLFTPVGGAIGGLAGCGGGMFIHFIMMRN